MKGGHSASVGTSEQNFCRLTPVQKIDSKMQSISENFVQHEHPDLGENSIIKTFTIHDNLLANPNHNPDILPDNR